MEYGFSTTAPTIEQPPDLVPCEKGWFYFREKCYTVRGQKSSERCSWTVAADRCKGMGGHLVTIQSKEELDFIVSFMMLNVKTHVWIGLHDQANESQYTWHDGSNVNYTNWNIFEPSGVKKFREDCVEMFFRPENGHTGKWNDNLCTVNNGYICQTNAKNEKISPDPTRCPSDTGGGWKFQESCYHVVKENKSWHDAEEHCGKHYNGGHLVTVLDVVVDNFLNYIMSDLKGKMWIGVSIKEQFQQQWTSGWYVGYNGLSEDKITYSERYCVARNKLEEWTLVECSEMLFFVCETSEATPTVLVSPGPEFHCPGGIDNLRDLGGEYCYYIESKNYFSWNEANSECERRGSNLASIHSKEENDILGPFIKYNPQYGVYIGLTRRLTQSKEFIWSDGSVMDFKNWNINEPNNLNEKCGEIHTRSLEWNDVDCDQRKGFICSVRKNTSLTTNVEKVDFSVTSPATTELEKVKFSGTSPATNVETVDSSGTSPATNAETVDSSAELSIPTNVSILKKSPDLVPCDKGWFYFREKCYRAGGHKSSDRLTRTDAAGRCKAARGQLVTIQSKEEQDFIVSFLLLDVKFWMWIGLNDQENESQYSWHDGSKANYTNWNDNEPTGLKSENEDCVELLFRPEDRVIGEWNDIFCTNKLGYICEAITTKRKIYPDPTRCSSDNGIGWKFQQSCYHIVKEKKSWHDAEEHCGKHYKGGHLVTVLDVVVDKFLNYILSDLKEEVWIGVSIKEQFQQQWTSGWYVGYNGLSEHKIMTWKGHCIARNKLEDWTLVECSKMLFFVCETSEATPPVLVSPGPEFHCPEGIDELRDLGSEYCYYIETKKRLRWKDANFECERRGGNLVTIHSKEENDILGLFINYGITSHIGLLRSLKQGEEFIWIDDSAMDFVNWEHKQPDNVNEHCGEMFTRSMEWNDVSCDELRGFICSVRKIGPSSSALNCSIHKNTSQTTNGETIDCSGQIFLKALIGVAICMVLLLIFLVVVICYFRLWDVRRWKKLTSSVNDDDRIYEYVDMNMHGNLNVKFS